MTGPLAKTVAVVTGGGTGIGRAVTLALARAGARAVVVTYRESAAEARHTVARARALGCEAASTSCTDLWTSGTRRMRAARPPVHEQARRRIHLWTTDARRTRACG